MSILTKAKMGPAFLGTAAAAVMIVSAASPAMAQGRQTERGHRDNISAGEVIAGVAILGGKLAILALLIKSGDLEEIDEAVILTPIIKANPVTFGLITRLQVEHGRRAKHPDHWRRSPRADHTCQRFAVKMIKR